MLDLTSVLFCFHHGTKGGKDNGRCPGRRAWQVPPEQLSSAVAAMGQIVFVWGQDPYQPFLYDLILLTNQGPASRENTAH